MHKWILNAGIVPQIIDRVTQDKLSRMLNQPVLTKLEVEVLHPEWCFHDQETDQSIPYGPQICPKHLCGKAYAKANSEGGAR